MSGAFLIRLLHTVCLEKLKTEAEALVSTIQQKKKWRLVGAGIWSSFSFIAIWKWKSRGGDRGTSPFYHLKRKGVTILIIFLHLPWLEAAIKDNGLEGKTRNSMCADFKVLLPSSHSSKKTGLLTKERCVSLKY